MGMCSTSARLLSILTVLFGHETFLAPMNSRNNFFVAAKVIHLNHAGASPSPPRVVSCLAQHQVAEQELGGYRAQAQAQYRVEAVYEKAASLIHAKKTEIALVESATVAWTRLFYSFCAAVEKRDQDKSKQNIILVSEAEYAANLVAACEWARSHQGWTVLTLPSKINSYGRSTGKVDLDCLAEMLEGNYRYGGKHQDILLDPSTISLICVTHVPTNSGIVNPAIEIGQLIDKHNLARISVSSVEQSSKTGGDDFLPSIFYLLDSCQSIGQMPVFVPEIKCHGLVATGRKFLRGPRGSGFLYIPESVATGIIPHHVDHYGLPIQKVPSDNCLENRQPLEEVLGYAPQPGAKRFEMWESNIASRLALGEALDNVLEKGVEVIQKTIRSRANILYDQLRAMPGITLHHKPESGICTFSINEFPNGASLDPAKLKELLWGENERVQYQFEVSVVPATSTPLDSARTRVPDLIRASVSYTNTVEDIHLFCERLESILKETGE